MNIPKLALITVLAATLLMHASAQNYPLTNRDLHATTVSPAFGPATLAFTADPSSAGEDIFDVVSSDPGVLVTLLAPSGVEIGGDNASGQGFGYQIIPVGAFSSGLTPGSLAVPGTHTVIQLPANAMPGTYTIELGSSGASGSALVIASYFSSSRVRAGLAAGKPSYQVGENVVFSGIVYDGSTPVTGAKATLSVVDSASVTSTPVQTAMTDYGPIHDATGDGSYIGIFKPAQPGRFTAAMQVTGTSASGVAFSRTASTAFRVLGPLAKLTSFQDSAVDDNGDGIIDRVVVTAGVSVQTAGKYQFGISFVSTAGVTIKSGATVALDTGDRQITVSFAPSAFARLAQNGPYARKDAVLVYLDDPENPAADVWSDAGPSASYDLSALKGTSMNSITADTSTLQFGNVPSGTSKDLTLTIHNGSAFPLIESVLPVNNPLFTVIGPSAPCALAAGADQKLTLRFSPNAAGAQTGTLTVAGLIVALSGAGVGVSGGPVLNASPASLDFGAVPTGQTKDLSVTVSNSGSTSVTLTATNAASPFTVQPAAFQIGPGAQQAVDVRFSPTDSTASTATIIFKGDDPAGSTIVIAVKGSGVVAAIVLSSDTFHRADAGQNSLGLTDLGLGGTQTYCYIPVWSGASIVSNALQNNGTGYGGVQFGQPGSGGSCSFRGQSIGQDLNIVVDLLVPPSDSSGNSSVAGPYFRNRGAAAADGILGGDSAGYWVQLDSSGTVSVVNSNTNTAVAATAMPAGFDNTVFHTLEVAVSGSNVQAALDHAVLTFVQGGLTTQTVAIPATNGSNDGTGGLAFSLAPKSGRIGGERAANMVLTRYRPLIGN